MGAETQIETAHGAKAFDASALGGELLTRPLAGDFHKSGQTAATDNLHALVLVDKTKPHPHQETPQQAYDRQHGKFEQDLKTYWARATTAKSTHNWVMDFPPVYDGPANPNPGKPQPPKPNAVPTVNEMVEASKHLKQIAFGDKRQPQYHLDEPSEAQFKLSYARETLVVGRQHGLAKDDVRNFVRSIYAFEDGGWGTHDTISGLPQALAAPDAPGTTTITDARRNFHRDGANASTAFGYNQLLMSTTMERVTEQSKVIADRLEVLARAEHNPARAAVLRDKERMITALGPALIKELRVMANEEARKPADKRAAYTNASGGLTDLLYRDFFKSTAKTAIGMTRRDMARAVHALNLDGDIGPIIQATEFGNLLNYRDKLGYTALLQGKEQASLRDLAAYDALPAAEKAKAVREVVGAILPATGQTAVPDTSRLTQKLLAMHPGVDANLAKDRLLPVDAELVRANVLAIRSVGEPGGKLSRPAQLLLNKISQSFYGGLDTVKLTPAALELANLSGPKNAQLMLDVKNSEVPTPNFFTQSGYTGNPVTHRRTSNELLMQIQRSMRGPNFDPAIRPGQADFERAFRSLP